MTLELKNEITSHLYKYDIFIIIASYLTRPAAVVGQTSGPEAAVTYCHLPTIPPSSGNISGCSEYSENNKNGTAIEIHTEIC